MKRLIVVIGAIALAGCSQLGGKSSSCSGADAASVTIDIVRDAVMRHASAREEEGPALSKSKVRATVRQLALTLEDVRTTKDDPNSTKQFCTGRLKAVVPAEVLQDANDTRQMAGLNTVEEMADNANVEANANAFTADIDFNVQPTDDGSKIYSQVENGDEAVTFLSEVVKSHLMKSAIADAKAEQDRMEAERVAAETAANVEANAAMLEEARAENSMAIETINAIWKAIPNDARSRIQPLQVAWIKKKDAMCRLEAAESASSEEQRRITKLKCDTREQNSRAQSLKQYATQVIQETYDE
jgi:uncharacterized protein YecT (DUF1311 family)